MKAQRFSIALRLIAVPATLFVVMLMTKIPMMYFSTAWQVDIAIYFAGVILAMWAGRYALPNHLAVGECVGALLGIAVLLATSLSGSSSEQFTWVQNVVIAITLLCAVMLSWKDEVQRVLHTLHM